MCEKERGERERERRVMKKRLRESVVEICKTYHVTLQMSFTEKNSLVLSCKRNINIKEIKRECGRNMQNISCHT